MDTVNTEQPQQSTVALHRAIPALLATSDYKVNIATSLQIIGDVLSLDTVLLLTLSPRQTLQKEDIALDLNGLLYLEQRAGNWQALQQRKSGNSTLVLAPKVIDELIDGQSLYGQYSQLFHDINVDWNAEASDYLHLMPLISNGKLKGVLGLGKKMEIRGLSEMDHIALITFCETIVHSLKQYDFFEGIQKERDELREILNWGTSESGTKNQMVPDGDQIVADAQLLSRKITTTIPDHIFIVDLKDPTNLYSNKPTFLGHVLDNSTNPFEFFQLLLHPEDVGHAFDDFFKKLSQVGDDDIIESEYRMFTKEGDLIWFSERVKVFKRDDQGQVWQYLTILQDITKRKLALQSEAESLGRYKNFVNYSTEGIYYVNCGVPIDINLPPEEQLEIYCKHAFIEEGNLALAQMYNLQSEQELIGITVNELHQGEYHENNQGLFLEFIKQGYRLEQIETIEKAADGQLKYFRNSAVGTIVDGHLIGNWGTQQDMSAKRKAELAQIESEVLFRNLFEKNPLGVLLRDATGHLLHCNNRMAEMLGYDPEDLNHHTLLAITHPEDVEGEAQVIAQTVAARSSLSFMEKRYMHRSGRIIWTNENISLLYHEDGQLKMMVAMIEDVTEKKKIRLKLEKNQAFQKAILTTLPDLKFRINKAGVYLDYYPSPNDERDLLLSPQAFLGKPIIEVIPKYIAEAAMANIHRALETGEVESIEYVVPADGLLKHYEMRISAINQDEVIAVVRNVSERNWAQLELNNKIRELDDKNKQLKDYIDSNLQLENFAYIASHDLREPLRTMGSFAQLLEKKYRDQLDDSGKTYIDFVVRGAKNLNNLIEDLLTFSKIESQENQLEIIALPRLLREVIAVLNEVIQANQAQIELNNIPAQIVANPSRLKQLFQNLLANAIKFKQADLPPKIQINCRESDQYWQFEVSDNGIGIDPEFQDKIFLLFKKLHSQKHYQGTGLGLAICKKVVDQMGGNIWVQSEVGKGASFFFTIKKK